VRAGAQQLEGPEGEQGDGRHRAQQVGRDGHPGERADEDDGGDGRLVPHRQGQQGPEQHPPAAALQPEGDGEQPAHRRIDPVEGAEQGDGQPRAGLTDEVGHPRAQG
jgi:hypothetical protein